MESSADTVEEVQTDSSGATFYQWRSHTRADQGFSPGNLHF